MKRIHTLGTAAIAAALCMPAWAQSTDGAKTRTTAKPTTAVESPSTTVAKANAAAGKPLCSELNHPNAGKLADKSTGKAKEHSASPVHQDCIPDTQPGARGSATGSVPSNNAATGTTTTNPSASTSSTLNGSTANSNSSVTGSSSDVSSSVTGSTSTVSPSIDLRGRSSVTIDNNTSTGAQSSSTNATTTTGNQSSSSGANATTGNQSASGSTSQSTKGGM